MRRLLQTRLSVPRPRFRLRTMLILVAIAALVPAGWRLFEREKYCLDRARSYRTLASQNERFFRDMGENEAAFRRDLANLTTAPELLRTVDLEAAREDPEAAARLLGLRIANCRRKVESYRELSRRQFRAARDYVRVARRPWLPLPSSLPPFD